MCFLGARTKLPLCVRVYVRVRGSDFVCVCVCVRVVDQASSRLPLQQAVCPLHQAVWEGPGYECQWRGGSLAGCECRSRGEKERRKHKEDRRLVACREKRRVVEWRERRRDLDERA